MEGAHCTGTEANLIAKSSFSGWGGWGGDRAWRKLGSDCAGLVPTGGPVLILRMGEGKGAHQISYSLEGISL